MQSVRICPSMFAGREPADASAVGLCFAGLVPYAEAAALQERLVDARLSGLVPDIVLFLEHEPVITLGARGDEAHILVGRQELARRGIGVERSSRGGGVTYHGPGQLVMYPIVKLDGREADSRGYLHALEEAAIQTASEFGVAAFRRARMTGAWTRAGKLAAIGVRFRRWVAYHGMSFNVAPDPDGFAAIVPCGLSGESVTSLRDLLGSDCPTVVAVVPRLARQFGSACGRKTVFAEPDSIPGPLAALLGTWVSRVMAVPGESRTERGMGLA